MMPYAEYLKSTEWQVRRRWALDAADRRCQVCYSNGDDGQGPLDVHHRTYDRVGAERPSDLTVLCRTCHSLYHGKPASGASVGVSHRLLDIDREIQSADDPEIPALLRERRDLVAEHRLDLDGTISADLGLILVALVDGRWADVVAEHVSGLKDFGYRDFLDAALGRALVGEIAPHRRVLLDALRRKSVGIRDADLLFLRCIRAGDQWVSVVIP